MTEQNKQPPSEAGEDGVLWVDKNGKIHEQQREYIFFLHGDDDGGANVTWSGTSFESAIEAWKELGPHLDITGLWAGVVASRDELKNRFLQESPNGTFSCPICGKETPHQHPADMVLDMRETQIHCAKEAEERWQKILAQASEIEAMYPARTSLYTSQTTATQAAVAAAMRMAADCVKKTFSELKFKDEDTQLCVKAALGDALVNLESAIPAEATAALMAFGVRLLEGAGLGNWPANEIDALIDRILAEPQGTERPACGAGAGSASQA